MKKFVTGLWGAVLISVILTCCGCTPREGTSTTTQVGESTSTTMQIDVTSQSLEESTTVSTISTAQTKQTTTTQSMQWKSGISKEKMTDFFEGNAVVLNNVKDVFLNLSYKTLNISMDEGDICVRDNYNGNDVKFAQKTEEILIQYFEKAEAFSGFSDYVPYLYYEPIGNGYKLTFQFDTMDDAARFAYSTSPLEGWDEIEEGWYVDPNPMNW